MIGWYFRVLEVYLRSAGMWNYPLSLHNAARRSNRHIIYLTTAQLCSIQPGMKKKAKEIPEIDDHVGSYWPNDKRFYAGVVRFQGKGALVNIKYYDEAEELLDLRHQRWRYKMQWKQKPTGRVCKRKQKKGNRQQNIEKGLKLTEWHSLKVKPRAAQISAAQSFATEWLLHPARKTCSGVTKESEVKWIDKNVYFCLAAVRLRWKLVALQMSILSLCGL